MATALELSYRHCRRLARDRARNFYYGFWLLPKPRRDAFCAVYAFMRHPDDVADGPGTAAEKAALLRRWHEALEQAYAGHYGGHPVLPAFHDAVQRYQIPAEYFHELIAGTEMDLTIRSYRTFEDLYQYCYRVAGVVGLCSLRMFGYRSPQAPPLAERCGIAFQLTNILRDVRQDAAAGRIYLPLEDLERFGCAPEQLAAGRWNAGHAELMRHEIARARQYYREAAPLVEMVEPESRAALWTLVSIYRGVLRAVEREVERCGGPSAPAAQGRTASLSEPEKLLLVSRAAFRRLQFLMGGTPDWRLLA
ncbi:MAG TPA: phytoene/squalene synthase family protein [Terriglobia bacterium]|nr:phytoene/squalene synthase family protein [Terriglobia bacterium]